MPTMGSGCVLANFAALVTLVSILMPARSTTFEWTIPETPPCLASVQRICQEVLWGACSGLTFEAGQEAAGNGTAQYLDRGGGAPAVCLGRPACLG